MALFAPRCSEEHGREMKMKDLNSDEEGDFPCKLQRLAWSHQNGNLMVNKMVIIVLLYD